MFSQALGVELPPPVPARSFAWRTPQIAGQLSGSRLDDSKRDAQTCLSNGQLEIAVVGHDHGGIDFLPPALGSTAA